MDSSTEVQLGAKMHELELSLVEGFAMVNATQKAHTEAMTNIVKTQDQIVDNLYGQGDEGMVSKISSIGATQKLIWTCVGGLGMIDVTLMLAHFAEKVPIV